MTDIAGSYVTIGPSNINTSKSSVQQLVDVVQIDIASTDSNNTRKSYEVFTSGSADSANITSSLFQTVYDQDFTLGTANPLFDVSIGSLLEEDSNGDLTVNEITSPSISRDAGGKVTGFSNTSAMMREKISIYRQFAQNLLGDANSSFFLPHSATAEEVLTSDNSLTRDKKIRAAVFICFRRLFTRDNMFKGSFGLRVEKSAANLYSDILTPTSIPPKYTTGTKITNIDAQLPTSESSLQVIDDSLSATNLTISPVSGEVSTLLQGTTRVGCIYYDLGIIVLDAERTFNTEQIIRGLIDSTRNSTATHNSTVGPFAIYGYKNGQNIADRKFYYPVYTATGASHDQVHTNFVPVNPADDATSLTAVNIYYNSSDDSASNGRNDLQTAIFSPHDHWSNVKYPAYSTTSTGYYTGDTVTEIGGKLLFNNKFYPNFWVSGTIDNVVDHICSTRFGRDNLSAITFRNETTLNSSLIFCRAAPTQLNYSTNPTYTDSDGNIIATSSNGEPFSFITTVGLYDSAGSLLAAAKTSRPIEKNPETDLSIRIRLDY